MIHPRDQWFRVYVFVPGRAGPIVDSVTKSVSVGWIVKPEWKLESETAHVHPPDAYHPDVRIRVTHHRKEMKQGFSLAACEQVQDPRFRYVEDHDEGKRCKKCMAATQKAIQDHAVALADLQAKAEEIQRKRQEQQS